AKIGIVKIHRFFGPNERQGTPGVAEYVRGEIERLKKDDSYGRQGMDGLILDIRDNPGGLLDEVERLVSLFIDKGAGFQIRSPHPCEGEVIEVREDNFPGVVFDGPLMVVVSASSASAAEILAGSLKAYNRALIVGAERTFGKGSVQTMAPNDHFVL